MLTSYAYSQAITREFPLCRTHDVRLVRLLSVHVHLVLFRIHGHRSNAQLVARTEHADRDLTAIGHQHRSNGFVFDLGRVLVLRDRPHTRQLRLAHCVHRDLLTAHGHGECGLRISICNLNVQYYKIILLEVHNNKTA